MYTQRIQHTTCALKTTNTITFCNKNFVALTILPLRCQQQRLHSLWTQWATVFINCEERWRPAPRNRSYGKHVIYRSHLTHLISRVVSILQCQMFCFRSFRTCKETVAKDYHIARSHKVPRRIAFLKWSKAFLSYHWEICTLELQYWFSRTEWCESLWRSMFISIWYSHPSVDSALFFLWSSS